MSTDTDGCLQSLHLPDTVTTSVSQNLKEGDEIKIEEKP
jgi:hypothetical protein